MRWLERPKELHYCIVYNPHCRSRILLTEKYEDFVDTNWFYLQVCVPVRGEGAEAAPGIRRQLFTSPPGAESRGKPWPASFLSIGHWISQVCRILLMVLFNTSPFLSSLWLYRIGPLEQLALVVHASLLIVLQISWPSVVFDTFLRVLKNNWPYCSCICFPFNGSTDQLRLSCVWYFSTCLKEQLALVV